MGWDRFVGLRDWNCLPCASAQHATAFDYCLIPVNSDREYANREHHRTRSPIALPPLFLIVAIKKIIISINCNVTERQAEHSRLAETTPL